MKAKLSGIICLILFLSVLKGCSTEVCACFHPTNIEMAISFEDQAGNDLLDQGHKNALNKANLNVFYLKEGEYKEKLNFSESLQIVQNENKNNYVLLTLSSVPFEGRQASLLIDFPRMSSDTLDVQAKGSTDELYAHKIWYNDELVWSNGEGQDPDRYFEITKEFQE